MGRPRHHRGVAAHRGARPGRGAGRLLRPRARRRPHDGGEPLALLGAGLAHRGAPASHGRPAALRRDRAAPDQRGAGSAGGGAHAGPHPVRGPVPSRDRGVPRRDHDPPGRRGPVPQPGRPPDVRARRHRAGGGTVDARLHRPRASGDGGRTRGRAAAGRAHAEPRPDRGDPAGRRPLLDRGGRHRGRLGGQPGHPRVVRGRHRAAAAPGRGAGGREPPRGGQARERGRARDQQPADRGGRQRAPAGRQARRPPRSPALLRPRPPRRPVHRRHDQPHDAHHPADAALAPRHRRRPDPRPARLEPAHRAGAGHRTPGVHRRHAGPPPGEPTRPL